MKYYVYILKSRKNGKHYIGYTQNLEDRIIRHNTNREKYTRGRGPWDLLYSEQYNTRSLAIKREQYLKKLKSHDYVSKELIHG